MGARPERKSQAHLPIDESGNRSIIIFLTVCTKDRRPILAAPEAHAALQAAWSRAAHWQVGRYVITPEHLHLFCAPGIWPPHPLHLWIRYWQNLVTRSCLRAERTALRQKDYWDRQLRSREASAQNSVSAHNQADLPARP